MRKLFILLLLALTASCSTNRIRYVRVSKAHREVVAIPAEQSNSEASITPLENPIHISTQDHQPETHSISTTATIPETYHGSDRKRHSEYEKDTHSDSGFVPEEDRTQSALEAERNAIKSKRNFRLSFIFLGLSIIPFLGILFILPTIILAIMGIVRYIEGSSARYITQRGEDALRAAKKMMIIWFVLVALLITTSAWLVFILL